MQTLQHEQANSVAAPQSEVHILRQRVAMLEQQLAAAEAKRADQATAAVPLTSIDFAPHSHTPHISTSEFSAPVEPAVVVVARAAAPAPAPAPSREVFDAPIESQPTDGEQFAAAWIDSDVSFEERVAAKAFFQEGSIDDQSRTWLLDS